MHHPNHKLNEQEWTFSSSTPTIGHIITLSPPSTKLSP
jgi:hypothetical protein